MTDPDRWRRVWKTIVDLGWSELAVPSVDGEGSFGPMDLAVVLEECGAALAPVPLLGSVGLAAGVLRNSGLDSVLTDIAGGVVATLAVHADRFATARGSDDSASGTAARHGCCRPQPVARGARGHAGPLGRGWDRSPRSCASAMA